LIGVVNFDWKREMGGSVSVGKGAAAQDGKAAAKVRFRLISLCCFFVLTIINPLFSPLVEALQSMK